MSAAVSGVSTSATPAVASEIMPLRTYSCLRRGTAWALSALLLSTGCFA